jgi:transposase
LGIKVIEIVPQMKILVAIEAVDGRKGIDSLARLCQEKLQEDPFSGCVSVFRSRRGTAIRLLSYDGQGYWLAQKRLSKGRFIWWPEASEPTKPLGSLRGTVADGGRRCVARARGADVAAGEGAEVKTAKSIPTNSYPPCVPEK